jgi:hypothetical protein
MVEIHALSPRHSSCEHQKPADTGLYTDRAWCFNRYSSCSPHGFGTNVAGHHQVAQRLRRQTLGQVVREWVLGLHVDQLDLTACHLLANEVVANVDVLRARLVADILRQRDGPLGVLVYHCGLSLFRTYVFEQATQPHALLRPHGGQRTQLESKAGWW